MVKIWQRLVWISLADFFCQHCHQNMATACLAGAQSNNAAILHPGHLRMSAAYKQPATPTSNWIDQLFDQGEAASDRENMSESFNSCLWSIILEKRACNAGGLHDSSKYLWSEVYMYNVYIPNLLFGLKHFVIFECLGIVGVPSWSPNSIVLHLDIYL